MTEHKTKSIPLSSIFVDESINSRSKIGYSDYSALAQNIAEQGLIQLPAVVARENGQYQVIAGFRRMRAIEHLKWPEVTCVVYEGLTDAEIIKINLTENLERKDLNPLEEAITLRRFADTGYTPEEMAEAISRSPQWVYSRLSILSLPDPIQEDVATGALTLKQVKVIEGLSEEMQYNYVRLYKERAEKASDIKVHLKRHQKKMPRVSKGKARTQSDMERVRDYLYHMFGTSIEVMALQWASGNVTYAALEKEIEEQAKMFNITYRGIEEYEKCDRV